MDACREGRHGAGHRGTDHFLPIHRQRTTNRHSAVLRCSISADPRFYDSACLRMYRIRRKALQAVYVQHCSQMSKLIVPATSIMSCPTVSAFCDTKTLTLEVVFETSFFATSAIKHLLTRGWVIWGPTISPTACQLRSRQNALVTPSPSMTLPMTCSMTRRESWLSACYCLSIDVPHHHRDTR